MTCKHADSTKCLICIYIIYHKCLHYLLIYDTSLELHRKFKLCCVCVYNSVLFQFCCVLRSLLLPVHWGNHTINHIGTHFLKCIFLCEKFCIFILFYSNFTEICSLGSNWWYVGFGSGNDLALSYGKPLPYPENMLIKIIIKINWDSTTRFMIRNLMQGLSSHR